MSRAHGPSGPAIKRLRELYSEATPGPWWLPSGYVIRAAGTSVGEMTFRADALLVEAMYAALPALLDLAEAAEKLAATRVPGRTSEEDDAVTVAYIEFEKTTKGR